MNNLSLTQKVCLELSLNCFLVSSFDLNSPNGCETEFFHFFFKEDFKRALLHVISMYSMDNIPTHNMN